MTQTLEDKDFEKALLRETSLTEDFRQKRARKFLIQYVQEGFTSVFDLGNSGQFYDAKLKDLIKNDSQYPLLFISGPGIATEKAQFNRLTPKSVVQKEYSIINDQTDIHKLLSEYVRNNVDILKIYIDNAPSVGEMSLILIKKILLHPLATYFKKITVHASNAYSLDLAVKAGVRNIEHATYLLEKKYPKNINVTATDLNEDLLREFNYYDKNLYLFQIERLKRIISFEYTILFGPDFYFHKEEQGFNRVKKIKGTLSVFKLAGMSNLEILRMMTLNPARSMKLEDTIGSIKPGAYANMIGVSGDPLSSIKNLDNLLTVINKGKIIKP